MADARISVLTENTTLANPDPASIVVSMGFSIILTQHATTAKTLAFGSYFYPSSGVAGVISTTLGAVNLLECKVLSATVITYTLIKNGIP